LGIRDAQHEESAPEAPILVIHKLTCSLVGQEQEVEFLPGSIVSEIYGAEKKATEKFLCNFGLNPAYQQRISTGGLVVSGWDSAREARAIELPDHRFFIGTLYLPQLSSHLGKPHPLIAAFLKVVAARS
jgi:CTP synthase (UTP-ammonia lyase)